MTTRVIVVVWTLALLCAASVAAIDVFYATRRRIAPTYLFDAAAQVAFLAALARAADEG